MIDKSAIQFISEQAVNASAPHTLGTGFTEWTCSPTSVTIPTISWPTVIPGTARGTLPCLMCRSLVQMLARVTFTMASFESRILGSGLSFSSKRPFSI